jgi:hypothetical protein
MSCDGMCGTQGYCLRLTMTITKGTSSLLFSNVAHRFLGTGRFIIFPCHGCIGCRLVQVQASPHVLGTF